MRRAALLVLLALGLRADEVTVLRSSLGRLQKNDPAAAQDVVAAAAEPRVRRARSAEVLVARRRGMPGRALRIHGRDAGPRHDPPDARDRRMPARGVEHGCMA